MNFDDQAKVFKDERYRKLSAFMTNFNKKESGVAAFNELYSRYKSNATRKRRSFNLTKDQFKELTSGKCHYCGVEPTQIIKHGKKYLMVNIFIMG